VNIGQRSPRSLAAIRSRVRTRRLTAPPYNDAISDIDVLLGEILEAPTGVPGSCTSQGSHRGGPPSRSDGKFHTFSLNRFVMGSRRSRPNALIEILVPGAAWRR